MRNPRVTSARAGPFSPSEMLERIPAKSLAPIQIRRLVVPLSPQKSASKKQTDVHLCIDIHRYICRYVHSFRRGSIRKPHQQAQHRFTKRDPLTLPQPPQPEVPVLKGSTFFPPKGRGVKSRTSGLVSKRGERRDSKYPAWNHACQQRPFLEEDDPLRILMDTQPDSNRKWPSKPELRVPVCHANHGRSDTM